MFLIYKKTDDDIDMKSEGHNDLYSDIDIEHQKEKSKF
jgi:hypothetical protein